MANNLLPEKLKQLRKARGLKQHVVAAELNIEQSTYSGYETGKHNPNPDMLYKLANLYGISIDTLMRLATKDDSENSDAINTLKNTKPDTPDNETKMVDDFLTFLNTPVNKSKYKELSAQEKELVYYFNQLSYIDKKDLLAFLKIRTSHTKKML